MNIQGKFIVLYGANNLGKSKQRDLLFEFLRKCGVQVKALKYPIYDLEPTGPFLDKALRHPEEVSLSTLDLQKIFVLNRKDFEPTLKSYLENEVWVLAEDYKGTGEAWGMANGISVETMEEINGGLIEPDLAILIDGEQFSSGIERGHIYESKKTLWNEARRAHMFLADKYGWKVIDGSRTELEVHTDIRRVVQEAFPQLQLFAEEIKTS